MFSPIVVENKTGPTNHSDMISQVADIYIFYIVAIK
jgi:hypothetical protein